MDDHSQGIFPKFGHFFQFLKKGRGDPPHPSLITRLSLLAFFSFRSLLITSFHVFFGPLMGNKPLALKVLH